MSALRIRLAVHRLAIVVIALGGALPAAAQDRAASPQESSEASFDVTEFQVEGNSVLPTLDIERAVYGHLGPKRTIKHVEAARAALEKTYHGAGYLTVLVDIPEQSVESGIVRLRVTEGRIERTRISGSRYYALGRIREQAPTLAEGSVPHFPTVQEELTQLNKTADRRVTPVLKPGRTPGKVEVELKVDDKLPLHGGLELNDRYSGDTSRLRLAGNLRYDNLWQRDHSVALQFQVAPQETRESRVFSATYTLPVGDADSVLALYALHSRSDVAAVGALNVIGNGTILGARHILPLPGSPGFFHSLTLGVDRKDFAEDVVLLGADTLSTPITYSPFVVQYAATDFDERQLLQFDAGLNFAVRGWLGNDDQEFGNKRFKASASYAFARLGMAWTRSLAAWANVHARVEGQATGSPLISNEQFAVGGVETVRAYRESEALGDDGARVTAELRMPFGERSRGPMADTYVVGFIDAASLRIQDPLPGQRDRFRLAGAGIGLRMKSASGFGLAIDAARALKDGPTTRDGASRFHFRLTYDF